MKKKLLILLTALVMAFSGSLVACGDGGEKVEKGVYNAAPTVSSIVTVTGDTTATAAYEEINEDFHNLVYSRAGATERYDNAKPLVFTTSDPSSVFTLRPLAGNFQESSFNHSLHGLSIDSCIHL